MRHLSAKASRLRRSSPPAYRRALPVLSLVALVGLAACGEATDTPEGADTTVPPLENPPAAPGTDDGTTSQ